MRRLMTMLAAALCAAALFAQEAEIAPVVTYSLQPVVNSNEVPAAAQNMLRTKMLQIAAKGDCATTAESPYVITCHIDVVGQELTPTAPPMHACTLSLTFFVGEAEGEVFAQANVEAKGAGKTPEKAYINAIKNVRAGDPSFKMMLDKAKKRMVPPPAPAPEPVAEPAPDSTAVPAATPENVLPLL